MIRKAKRVNRTVSLSEEGKFGGSGGEAAAAGARMMKNSKKSRSGFGRGLPKKGERTTKGFLQLGRSAVEFLVWHLAVRLLIILEIFPPIYQIDASF